MGERKTNPGRFKCLRDALASKLLTHRPKKHFKKNVSLPDAPPVLRCGTLEIALERLRGTAEIWRLNSHKFILKSCNLQEQGFSPRDHHGEPLRTRKLWWVAPRFAAVATIFF